MELDVTTDETRILYGGIPQQELLSIERGKVDVTAGGNLLITEFEGGRVLEIDAEGRPLWTYLNRYDNNLVAELSEARMYPARYFDGVEWSCEQ
jgi:hypothetical protein